MKDLDSYLVGKNFETIKQSRNNIILFGSVGAGKTTLINKLCNVELITKEDGFSCTREVQFARTPDGNLIIDFPGLNSAEEIVKHLKIQKSTLSMIPARLICLVIKLSARYDDLVKSTLQMVRIFADNRKNLALIITKTEDMTMKQGEEIRFAIEKKCKIDRRNIIFSSNKVSDETLRNEINKIKNSMTNIEKIVIKDRDLLNTVGTDGDIDVIEDSTDENALKVALYYSFVDFKENLIERFSNVKKK